MEFILSQSSVSEYSGQAILLPILNDGAQTSATQKVDASLGGFISQIIENKDITGKPGETLVIHRQLAHALY